MLSITNNIPIQRWEFYRGVSERDLIVKKIAFTMITLSNFAILGGGLYLIINYCPIPAQALVVSPFIAGILGALAYLKFPTCGIHARNYTDYVNPLSLVGRAAAYVFFGPLIYASQSIDWTPYHDAIQANRISNDLKKDSFETVAKTYGKNFSNLILYGFIAIDHQERLENFYLQYKHLKESVDFWKKEGLEGGIESQKAKQQIDALSKEWDEFKTKFENELPQPEMPPIDFTKKSTRAKLFARKYCCTLSPLHLCADF